MLKNNNNLPILILGDDPVNVLGVARNLGRLGIPVYRLGSSENRILRSRYIESTWLANELEECTEAAYVDHLREAAQRIGSKAVLFPLSDIHVLRVSSNVAELSEWYLHLAPDISVAEMLVNKRKFCESLRGFGVAHPASRFPRDHEEFLAAADEIGYPVFLKPEISPLFAREFQSKGLVAENSRELLAHLDRLDDTGLDVMVQEIIPGDATCMHGCAGLRAGSQIFTFSYQRIREFPPNFGCGSLMTSIPDIVDQTGLAAYLDGIDYRGIFDAEFKFDPRQGVFKIIEINARSWWQNLHPTASGFNIIKGAYDLARGFPINLGPYGVNVTWMHLYNDYFARKEANIGIFEWIRSLRSVSAFDIWAADDVGPMLAFLSQIGVRKIGKLLRVSKSN